MICKFGFGGMMEMIYIAKDIPLWQVTIWDKKFNNVDKKWQPKTIKYKYLLSDELDSLRVDDGDVRILYTGKDVGFTTEELAGDRLSEGEIISIPWGGIPTVKYHKGKFVTGDNRIATSKDINKLTNKYLYYFMRGNIHEIASYYRGASLKHPCMKDILKMTISYPSVQEQDKICGQFDVLEQIIEVRKQELQLLDDLIKARFVEMFGDCTNMISLSDLCLIITDGTHQSPKFQHEGIPFILVSNLSKNTVTYDTDKFISAETYKELYKRTPIEIGDILLSTVGSYGHPAVVVEDRKFLFQRHIAYLKPKSDILNSYYMHGALLSPGCQRQIEEKVKGIAQKTLNLSEIRKIRIPVPSLDLQKQYADFVHQVNKSKFDTMTFAPIYAIINLYLHTYFYQGRR